MFDKTVVRVIISKGESMYADVLVEVKTKDLEKMFTYRVPDSMVLSPGMRVLVPFGKRNIEGFVMKIYDYGDFDYEVRDIVSAIDERTVINEEMMELGKYISLKTLCPLILAYQTMLPRALKAKVKTRVNKKYATYVVIDREAEPEREKQKEVYDYVKKNGKVLKSSALKISSAVKTLIDKGYLKEVKEEVYRFTEDEKIEAKDFKLTFDQKKVIGEIDLNKFKPYLLHGVTGSGKTLVYIKLILDVLKEGKEAIVLVPEISLTPQTADTFRGYFGNKVAILHSGLSEGEKYDEWRRIERGEVSIAIGARSAVFAPFTNLGIIIVDEEHSASYKQDSNPKYNAIDIALKRGKTYGIPVVLGSATPSVESYTRAKMGIYKLLEMKKRINEKMPKVYLVDMKEEFKKGNRLFSDILVSKVNERLNSDEQIIVLLNRRGFSTVISCKECGFTHKCPNCDIPLTYHKSKGMMRCHYCDYTVPKLYACPICKSKNINSLGMGTEKLEEEFQKRFPNAKTIRMDTDTTHSKGAHRRIVDEFREGKYNVLVGTQMIAKGLDFPKVTLVLVFGADTSLNIPDFRSAERTFELLNQVVGRAGRAKLNGEAILQGFNMNHYSIVAASKNDYEMFYNEEMKIRKVLKYPPYYNLALVKISSRNYEILKNESSKIAVYLRDNLRNNIILGPGVATIPKVNNVYYMNIIIKYKKTIEVINPLKFILGKYAGGKVAVSIDLNPTKL